MRKKQQKIIGGVGIIFLFITLLGIVNHFQGNPFSKEIANRSVPNYLAGNYGELQMERTATAYDKELGLYTVTVNAQDSVDTHFSIHVKWNGKIIEDSYQSDVAERWNTYRRISQQYRDYVDSLIRQQLPYEFDIILTELWADKEATLATLPLDMKLDVENPPLKPRVTIYIYTEDLSWAHVASVTTELDQLMQENHLIIDQYSVLLQPRLVEGEQKGYSIGVYDFPREKLEAIDLAKTMEAHFQAWQAEVNKQIEMEHDHDTHEEDAHDTHE